MNLVDARLESTPSASVGGVFVRIPSPETNKKAAQRNCGPCFFAFNGESVNQVGFWSSAFVSEMTRLLLVGAIWISTAVGFCDFIARFLHAALPSGSRTFGFGGAADVVESRTGNRNRRNCYKCN